MEGPRSRGRSRNAVPTPAAATSPASNRKGWLKALLSFPSIVFPPFPYLTKVKKRKIVKQGQRNNKEGSVNQELLTVNGGCFSSVLQQRDSTSSGCVKDVAVEGSSTHSRDSGARTSREISSYAFLRESSEPPLRPPACCEECLCSGMGICCPSRGCSLDQNVECLCEFQGNECIGDVCGGKRREDEASGVLCQDARSKGPDGLNSKNHHDEERVKVPFSNAMEESITQANKGSRNLCVRSALRPSNVQKELIADNGTTWRAIGNTDNDQWPCFAGNAPQVPELGKICYGSAQKANGGFSDFIREQGDTRNDRRRRRIVKDVWLGGYKTVQKNADTSNWPLHVKMVPPIDMEKLIALPIDHEVSERLRDRSRWLSDSLRYETIPVNQKPKNHHISMADIQQLLKAGIIEFAPEDIVYGDILCFDVPEVSKHRRRWINATYSINELLVESQQFSLTNVKRIKELVLAHSKKGHVVASFDQSAAYHQLHIRGEVRKYFRFINNNVTYQLCRAATGDAHMCSVQQAVAEAFISVEIQMVYLHLLISTTISF